MKGQTKMKNLKKCLFAALCLALAVGLAACGTETDDVTESSSQPESSAVSAVSSQPEVSSTFIPADDLISTAPEVVEGETEGFEYEFSQNPIDKQYDEDYSMATSYSMMRQACGDAASRWKNMVEYAYTAAIDATPEDEQYNVIQQHQQWLAELDAKLDEIHETAGDDNEGILAAEKETVLIYREHAKELCKIKYDIDGTLPDFPDGEELSPLG